ncbi:MAG: RecX family transcriptional regulator, partial [bacterium]|nr:RecX family transcriptional regulator [bacterium]MDW8164057.1 RecX family transcriptional regulator [Candidatus Omnitrophota bacterium]
MKNEELKRKILRLLSKKDYSEKEIIEKFPTITPSILKKLKRQKFIDDFSLSQRIIEKLQNKGKGYYYILQELERRKIKKEIIEKLKKEYDFKKEFEICKKIVEKMKD